MSHHDLHEFFAIAIKPFQQCDLHFIIFSNYKNCISFSQFIIAQKFHYKSTKSTQFVKIERKKILERNVEIIGKVIKN